MKGKNIYFYLLEIGKHKKSIRPNAETVERALKIGITNNMERRLKEHKYKYQTEDREILFISEPETREQAKKMEDRNRKKMKGKMEWIPQDRFFKPKELKEIILERRSRKILYYRVEV